MLRLRPFKKSDYDYVVKWQTTEKSFHQWCADHFQWPLTLEQLYAYYEKQEEDNSAWIMTAVDESGTPVGFLEMQKNNYEEESTYLAHVIIDSFKRGKGYGTEMISKTVRYAFDILDFKKVVLHVYANNEGAHACYKKAGLQDTCLTENVFEFEGESWAVYEMAITK